MSEDSNIELSDEVREQLIQAAMAESQVTLTGPRLQIQAMVQLNKYFALLNYACNSDLIQGFGVENTKIRGYVGYLIKDGEKQEVKTDAKQAPEAFMALADTAAAVLSQNGYKEQVESIMSFGMEEVPEDEEEKEE